jgi:hypothetical protein
MPRYEFVKPGTPDRSGINPFTRQPIVIKGIPGEHHFWEVEIEGDTLHFARGQVGKSSSRWSRTYVSPLLARQAAERAKAARLEVNYQLAGDSVFLRQAPAVRSTPATSWEGRLAASPDDEQLLAACAEDLRSAGVALGEVPAEIAAWADDDYRVLELEWKRGLVQKVRTFTVDRGSGERSLEEVLGILLESPVGRFVRDVVIGVNGPASKFDQAIAVLAGAQLPLLETVFIGDYTSDEMEISWTKVGACDPLWSLPALREVIIKGGGIDLGVIDAPRLESLEVRTGGLAKAALRSILHADAPNLRALRVWFGDSRYGAECEVGDVLPLLAAERFPRLEELGLMNAEFTDELCTPILESAILPRLRVLDLSYGTLTDDGAAILAGGLTALKHLRTLKVDENLLGHAGLGALAPLGATLQAEKQRRGSAKDRYVAFGE